MEVETDRYFSSEDLFDGKTSSLSGFVTSYTKLEKLIETYECATSSRYRTLKSSKHFGKKIDVSVLKKCQFRLLDSQKNSEPYLDYDGIPFLILGKKSLECHQGPDRDGKTNERKQKKSIEKSDHTYRKKRRRVQTSKKKGCPAKVRIRHVLKFPSYQLEEKEVSKYCRNTMLSGLREDFIKDLIPSDRLEHRFYVQFPDVDDHLNHLKGEASCTLQPMDKRLSDYIKRVVAEYGVTSTIKMKLLLEVFLKESIFKDTLPPKHNKRFWPSLKDIYNRMASHMLKIRDSCIDQQLIQEMVNKEKDSHPSDKFYIRIKNDHDSESVIEEPDESLLMDEDFTIIQKGCRNKFLYVHQTRWQQQLLKRYGNEMCLLDATYRTTRYSLPLYFLCVPTNVNYMTVGTFIVESEDTPSIQEALSILKAWNLEWKPTYFMCDYANEEINALESVFPESFVYLCDFHREQSWDRWLKASHNNIGEDKAEILSLFRSMAHANTVEKFEMAKANLEESRLWTENSRLRKWFTDRWLDKHKRWVHAFRQMRYNASVNSTNGVERQNKCPKYEFLETKKAKSVSHLLTVLWNEFLPDLYQRYVRQNLSSSEEARAYDKDIPTFLRNRPGSVVKHCFKRWEDSVNISVDDIDEIGEGNFLVHSQAPGSSEVYTVNFSPQEFPIPSCTCEDWRKHHLICKHFCAIFRCTAWKWEHLPEAYRNNPFITLDDDILHNFSSYPVGKNIGTSESDSESETLVKGVQPLRMPSQSRLSKLRSNISSICELIKSYVYTCKDEDFLQRLCNNLHNTTETLRDTLCERNEFVVDEEKSMTHIATKKVRRLSLSKRKKGTGRHGLSADVLRSHSSKGVEDLLNRENDEGKVEEEVITIGDNDPCVLDTGVRSILKKRRSNSTTKKRVHFSDLCSSYEHEDLQQKIIMDCNQALQEVKKLWSLERGTGYVVGKVDDFNVTDTDIRSLYGTRWVTDQVMDAYLAYIVHREIEKGNLVALYPSQTMRSIVEGKFSVQKCRQKLKLWEYSTIIGAVCQNCHWTLVIIDSGNRILTFLNPKQEGRSQLDEIKKNWCSYIKERRQMYKELEAEDDNWSVQTLKHSRQRDAFNCGVYCLMFADRYFLKEPLTNITDDSLSRAREEIATLVEFLYLSLRLISVNEEGIDINGKLIAQASKSNRNVFLSKYQQEKREDQGKDDKKDEKIETMETNSESDDAVIHRQDGYEDTNPSSRQSSTKKIYEQEKREDQGKDEKSETMETNSEDTVIHRQDGYDNTNPSSRQSSTNRSEINTDFIAKHVNSIVNTLADMMNCSLSKCDEAEHKRHHEFIRSPEKMYADNYLKYCFGAKYIEPEDFEYLQQILGERICVNKFLPGSIFSRYSSFKNLDNEELEKIFIDSPLMGHEYFKFVILKEAVTYLVCCNTGLPYEESDERCSQTEASVAQHKRVQEGCFPFNL